MITRDLLPLAKPISMFTPDPANARKHDEKSYTVIMNSLRQFGQRKPIVAQEKDGQFIIRAGNGTLEAAKRLGWTEIAAVIVNEDSVTSTAYAVADNQTALVSTWDDDVLNKTLKALVDEGVEVGDFGFDLGEFDLAPPSEGLTDPDAVPEVEQNIHNVKLGDIWQLGDHRLMCGDSTVKENVERLMNGEKADMVFTDPPYGMRLSTDYTSFSGKGSTIKRTTRDYKPVHGDDADFDFLKSYALVESIEEQFWWGADYYCQQLPKDGSWFVWNKRTTENLEKMHGNHFELCWSKKKHQREIANITWAGIFGHNKQDDGATKVHPTMKSVKLIDWFFEKFKGDLVIDLFLGSGSTLIACEKTGRKCYGMELDTHYCNVIIERWQQFTGKTAILESNNTGAS